MQDSLQKFVDNLNVLPETAPHYVEFVVGWALSHGIRILFIIAAMWFFIIVAKIIGKRIIHIASDDDPSTENERERRTKTLVQIFNLAVRVVVVVFGGISILKEFGFDIAPILAGAGIIGLAIGFGSQSLVKDIVSGFFLIMENQIRVGDVVKIADVAGLVEKITLRIVVLRDLQGIMHVIPNGEIKILSNMTYGWSRAVLDVEVAYKERVDHVIEILTGLGKGIFDDEAYRSIILEQPTVLGVDSLGESGVTIRMLIKTIPLKQWDVAREFRRRIKNEFDGRGIEIPFPQRTIHIRQEHDLGDGPRGNLSKDQPGLD